MTSPQRTGDPGDELGAPRDDLERRLFEEARLAERDAERQRRLARPEDYVFDKAQEAFWDIEDNTLHSEKAVDASIPQELWRVVVIDPGNEDDEGPRRRGRPRQRREQLVPPSRDIMRVENDRFVEGSTWWPGMPKIIRDWFIDKDGAYPVLGRRSFNQYRSPPTHRFGREVDLSAEAARWIEHVKKLWPDPREHEYFFDFCAHMVQRPDQKCNAAIVLSGTQGIGKDAALEAVKEAVGAWNYKGIDPDELFAAYQPWRQTLMLVIDEVRPSKDEFHASSMYNVLKPLIAAPPHTLPLNQKYEKLRYIINVLRVFITTNDWMAMYIPPEDRRMFVMHSTLPQKWHIAEGAPDYFREYFAWLYERGAKAVGAWLAERDLSHFDPKAQVSRTTGWEAVAGSWGVPDDSVSDALETLGRPDVFFGQELLDASFDSAEEMAAMLKSPRRIAHRLQREGYLLRRRADGNRYTFGGGANQFRSRLAFIRHELSSRPAEVEAALEARGKELARKLAERGGKVRASSATATS